MNIARAISTHTAINYSVASIIAINFQAAGYSINADDIMGACSTYYRDPFSGSYVVPNRTDLGWSFDDLQDALSDAGLTGQALYAGWATVMGHLQARFARGNFAKPRIATALRWAGFSPLRIAA